MLFVCTCLLGVGIDFVIAVVLVGGLIEMLIWFEGDVGVVVDDVDDDNDVLV